MNLRTVKHHHLASAMRVQRQMAYAELMNAEAHHHLYPDDDYYNDDDDLACTHCGGEGYREVEDPLWDDCDEFGYGPCTSCRGTGQRKHQWVF